MLSLERGALQGVHAYKPVAWSLVFEAVGRLDRSGVILVVAGLGVTGAYLGTPLSLHRDRVLAVARGAGARFGAPDPSAGHAACWSLMGGAWARSAGLFLLAMLQNVDVIMVKRQIGGDEAGAYAAAAVAAKAVVWVAIGIGLYLLPEATRARAARAGPAAGADARARPSWARSRSRC